MRTYLDDTKECKHCGSILSLGFPEIISGDGCNVCDPDNTMDRFEDTLAEIELYPREVRELIGILKDVDQHRWPEVQKYINHLSQCLRGIS